MKRKNPTGRKPKYRVIYGSGFTQDCFSRTEAIKLVDDIFKSMTYSSVKIEKV